ncbi:MAG: anaerobic ribonucleoside-triphosphate reductase activating protein [Holosporaceae bacterium]|jgi:pyruvate formate lyase activating enzyme|nr:anaerobic ribonucleoside-triphosphate reductase activating protein [Holosporaceae bacterium]
MEKSLFVGGVVSLTTLDYPGYLSTVVFLQGCPWRCVYCHNRHLQSILPTESLPWEDILNLLEIRRGFVEAVVFSGGEPLMQECLSNAIRDVKAMGFKIGLHTSGALPQRFANILPLVDWVGFDLKYSFQNYQKITNIKDSGVVALESLHMLIDSGVDFEVRMTLCEEMETAEIVEVLKEISKLGVKTVALQKCRDKGESVVEHAIFSDKLLLDDMSKYFDNFFIR